MCALQFNEGSYGNAFQQGQNNVQADRDRRLQMLQESIQGLNVGAQTYQNRQVRAGQAEQQKKLYELQLQEAHNKNKDRDLENTPLGQLLSSNSLSQGVAPTSMLDQMEMPQGMGEAALPMGQQPGGSMIDKFRQFQQGKLRAPQMDMSQQQPDLAAFGLPPEAAGMTLGQVKRMGEARKLFADAKADKQPGSYGAALAQKYNNGEITLDEFGELTRQNSGGSFMMGGMNAQGQPVFYNTKDPSNVRTATVPGGGMLYPKTPSEGQMNAGLFGKRAMEADQQLSQMIGAGLDPTSIGTGGQEYLPNIMKGSGMQQFDQAKRNFINAVLRKESGAMISNQEMENANKQYFPQIGDQSDVLKQKEVNRQTAIQGLGTMAGPMGNQMRGGGQPGTDAQFPVVTDQAGYNSLASGAQYKDAKGITRRTKLCGNRQKMTR